MSESSQNPPLETCGDDKDRLDYPGLQVLFWSQGIFHCMDVCPHLKKDGFSEWKCNKFNRGLYRFNGPIALLECVIPILKEYQEKHADIWNDYQIEKITPEQLKKLTDRIKRYQTDIDPEFNKVVNNHFWELI